MPLHLVRPLLELVRWADALLAWLLTYALHSTILILAVWLLADGPLGRRLRLTNASWLWMVALCGGLLTATLQTSGVLSPVAGTVRVVSESATTAMVRLEVTRTTDVHAPLPAFSGPRKAVATVELSRRWPIGVVLGWVVGAAVLLAGFLFVRWRFLRSLAARRDAEFTVAGSALREVLQRVGIRRPIRLTMAEGLTSPVAIGRDEICLPRRVLAELDPIQQESMLAHELAHLERRDARWLLLARLIEAVFFFQPLNRLARRRMQDAAEFASDAWALRVLGKPVVLARCLARVAEWSVASPRLIAPAMTGRPGSMLVQRVERLTSGRAARERGPGRLAVTLTAGAVLLLALLVPKASVGAPPSRAPGPSQRVTTFRLMSAPDAVAGRMLFRGVGGDELVVLRLNGFGSPTTRR
ncbi:MAG TPA: M56 family metallopeptidase [Gemmatimonadaceae bacterium]|nr:M56 family metallopeptidase [Gemmatimonadaceae bacterium]